MAALTIPDLCRPVRFTSDDGNTSLTFTDAPKKGGEGHLFRDGDWAWKLLTSKETYERKLSDYNAASDSRLPMGGNPKFVKGTIKEFNGNSWKGFAIRTQWMAGTDFYYQKKKKGKTFKVALRRETIPPNGDQYQQILAACNIAQQLPLADVQGFVDANNEIEPVSFFDIHIAPNGSSTHADQLMKDIVEWGNGFRA